MPLLTGDIQKQVFAAFKGKLLKGFIRQSAIDDSAALDDLGDVQDSAYVDIKIEGFTENYSDYFQKTSGIPDGDVKVNIFAASAPTMTPGKDNKVMFRDLQDGVLSDVWYQLRGPISKDPATALWTCQALPIPAPA